MWLGRAATLPVIVISHNASLYKNSAQIQYTTFGAHPLLQQIVGGHLVVACMAHLLSPPYDNNVSPAHFGNRNPRNTASFQASHLVSLLCRLQAERDPNPPHPAAPKHKHMIDD